MVSVGSNRLLSSSAAFLWVACLPSCTVGPTEMWPIAAVALLLFGGAKLPGLMRSMGSGIHEFRRGLKKGEDEESLPPTDSDSDD